MNKKDLIRLVAQRTSLSLEQSRRAVETLLEAITNELAKGNGVRIPGFGNFQVAQRKASTGRNPRTGQTIAIPASKIPKFKAGKSLKDFISTSDIAASTHMVRPARALRRRMEPDFHARRSSATSAPDEETTEETAASRYLQARVTSPGPDGETVSSLERNTDYEAEVFIGSTRDGWLALRDAIKEPPPNRDGSPHKLHVVFSEPNVCPEPQIKELNLWPKGDTEACSFPFTTAGDVSEFSARISVHYKNRNLQTGLLRGTIGGEEGLTFVPDAAPAPRFSDLEGRAGVGASFILNNDKSGRCTANVFADGQAEIIEVTVDLVDGDSLERLTDALGHQITQITAAPENYDHLAKEGTRELLAELAERGATLLRRLKKDTHMGNKLDDAAYVQIVRTHLDSFFPMEFLYEGLPPEPDAIICDGAQDAKSARDALSTGKCCGAYDDDPENTVCPLKFWSLSKVIERHSYLPDDSLRDGKFTFRSAGPNARNRALDPLNGIVLGASNRVDRARPDTLSNLQQSLSRTIRSPDVPIGENWNGLATQIQSHGPQLLVLIPHHEYSGGNDSLEIGGDYRRSTLIRRRHVRPEGNDDLFPVVLLIGCETNMYKINLESAVIAFQDHGAAIVVSTIGSILGREAGPAIAAIVEELDAALGRQFATFGEAMLAVRRRLLADGMPMVLGLTSYGDADWLIARPDAAAPADDGA